MNEKLNDLKFKVQIKRNEDRMDLCINAKVTSLSSDSYASMEVTTGNQRKKVYRVGLTVDKNDPENKKYGISDAYISFNMTEAPDFALDDILEITISKDNDNDEDE